MWLGSPDWPSSQRTHLLPMSAAHVLNNCNDKLATAKLGPNSIAERYERGSVVLTSNLAFSGWETIFKDPMTTAAAIDRLVHHSVILELNVPSYRAEQAKKAGQKPSGPTDPSREV